MKLYVLLLFICGFILIGCEEKPQNNADQSMQKKESEEISSGNISTLSSDSMKVHELKQSSAETASLVCVVTGEEADPEMFTEYNGKKYYFCCEKCQRLFSKNPHKYINKN